MWNPGDVIAWRGIAGNRPWHIQSAVVVDDKSSELVVTVLPGAEGVAEKTYAMGMGKKNGSRRWDFKGNDWELANYLWHTNRVLAITEPGKYYSIMLFWNHERNEFIGYYVNFQLPFLRSHCGIDTLDLDLDIDIDPDLTFKWKDEDDYQNAIYHGLITLEWIQGIESAKPEIFERLEKRQYPFDGSWLDWKPDPSWSPPKLPENWDKI
jgi:predicted RNA-binding protein associated with RNAse of E/G family